MAAFLWAVRALCGVSLLAGAACLRWPRKAIAFQQWFYLRINWRMELRNTRLMGLALVLLALSAFLVS